ncbi:MAG: hypothetical protein VX371_11410, partial [Verrucomicrobiota bacterium]|nr:hypothetical protein [Verrucomicrobiota bacterium]
HGVDVDNDLGKHPGDQNFFSPQKDPPVSVRPYSEIWESLFEQPYTESVTNQSRFQIPDA